MIDALLLIAGSALLLWWSRKPLRHPGGHGFYRFFAWEGILGLLVLNRGAWITPADQPLALHELAAAVLLLGSLVLALAGIRRLRRQGGGRAQREEGEGLYDFEKTTSLVTSGIFHYIRHPMYASLLALAWGLYCQDPSQVGAALALLTSGLVVLTAKADERECARYFGADYAAYKRRTKMFIPFVL